MIRIFQAENFHLPALMELYREAMLSLHAQGVDQWDDEYPFGALPEDILRGELFIAAQDDGLPLAAIVLNDRCEPWHKGLPWTQDDALYVHRLAVHPRRQGSGLARTMMGWAHAYAAERGIEWVHLDTNRKNIRAMRLYEGLGYSFVADIQEGDENVYACMERPAKDAF